ncbi:MAG: hypothetical protein PHQ98_01160 [Candidatus ainarchaeum sp.]|nr:hypothetical protein [Candidatus ainarchaeum sp.]
MGKSIYIVALVATITLFSLIFFSINSIETQRFNSIDNDLKNMIFEYQIDQLYSDFNQTDCGYINSSILKKSEILQNLNSKLENYKDNFFKSDYYGTKKNLLLVNMFILNLVDKSIVECKSEIKPILYFYSEDDSCTIECESLEVQLDNLKSVYPEIRIFAFPYKFKEFEFTQILEKKYNVTKSGTLVINGKTFDSIQTNETLLKELNSINKFIDNNVNNSNCICTMEYAPVCDLNTNKTYGNKCAAKCDGVTSYLSGECIVPKMCGGIAGLPCDENSYCKLDGNYPDASGICISNDCPIYSSLLCKNNEITTIYDLNGCQKPVCLESN